MECSVDRGRGRKRLFVYGRMSAFGSRIEIEFNPGQQSEEIQVLCVTPV